MTRKKRRYEERSNEKRNFFEKILNFRIQKVDNGGYLSLYYYHQKEILSMTKRYFTSSYYFYYYFIGLDNGSVC